MKKIIVMKLLLYLPNFMFSQEYKKLQNNYELSFHLEAKKVDCSKNVPTDYSNEINNLKLNCQIADVKSLVNFITFVEPLRIFSNDNTKLAQCVSLTRSEHLPVFEPCKVCETALEKALDCHILDTMVEMEVWKLRVGAKHQLKPLTTDKNVGQVNFALGVYDPPSEELTQTAYIDNIIAKNGVLSQIVGKIEKYSGHIVELEDSSKKSDLFTFEISKSILQSGDFERIRTSLKESIDFDLNKVKEPIRVKYIKFN